MPRGRKGADISKEWLIEQIGNETSYSAVMNKICSAGGYSSTQVRYALKKHDLEKNLIKRPWTDKKETKEEQKARTADEERTDELIRCLQDLRSRHTRLLIKYIHLEDKYNELKDKFDLLTINATNTVFEKYQIGSKKEEEIETTSLSRRGQRITENL